MGLLTLMETNGGRPVQITTTAATPAAFTLDLGGYPRPVWVDWGDGAVEVVRTGLLAHNYANQAARTLRVRQAQGWRGLATWTVNHVGVGLALADVPRVTNTLNLNGCNQVTGDLADLPRVTNTLNLNGCNQVTGDLADAPRVSYYLNLAYCNQVTGDLADAPRVTYHLTLYGCNLVTGDLADAPRVTNNLDLYGCNQVTGNLADAPRVTNTLRLTNCNQVTGDLADAPRVTYYLNLNGCNQVTGNLADAPRVTNTLGLNGCNQVTGNLADAPRVSRYLALSGCNQVAYAPGYLSTLATTAYFYLASMAWDQASVDSALAELVAAQAANPAWTTCNLDLAGNAAPSAAGVADADILRAKGWTVTTA